MLACASFSVMSDFLQLHGLQPARVFCPWDFPGKNPEWVAISFSRRSSQLMNRTWVSCIGKSIVYHWATWLPLGYHIKDFFLQTPMLKIMIPPWTLDRAAEVNFDRLKDSRLDYYKKGKWTLKGCLAAVGHHLWGRLWRIKKIWKRNFSRWPYVWLLMTKAWFNGCWILCHKRYTSQCL